MPRLPIQLVVLTFLFNRTGLWWISHGHGLDRDEMKRHRMLSSINLWTDGVNVIGIGSLVWLSICDCSAIDAENEQIESYTLERKRHNLRSEKREGRTNDNLNDLGTKISVNMEGSDKGFHIPNQRHQESHYCSPNNTQRGRRWRLCISLRIRSKPVGRGNMALRLSALLLCAFSSSIYDTG